MNISLRKDIKVPLQPLMTALILTLGQKQPKGNFNNFPRSSATQEARQSGNRNLFVHCCRLNAY